MSNIKGIIFDLDGTLLDTIGDITKALNYALEKNNYPTVTVNEAKYLVGNGAKVLIKRTLDKVSKESYDEIMFNKVYDDYMYSYNLWKYNTTKPYQSVIKTLHILKRKNVLLGVISNKPERDTCSIVKKYFGDIFDFVRGGRENVPLKPNPTSVNEMIEEMNLSKEEVLYVGDSDVDMQTSVNAEVVGVGCCYGFRTKKELVDSGAKHTINSMYDLLNLFEKEPSGILLLNKQKHITSQDCITKAKKKLGLYKIGHAGTLDPLASGLLVVLLGDATKLSDYLLHDNKEYIAEVTIGISTTTLDGEGTVVSTKNVDINLDEKRIDDVLNSLIGDITLSVPLHSAVKINGKKLYDYARSNKEVVAPVKDNVIYNIKRTTPLIYVNNTLKFSFTSLVSKGTYIRTLCEEIGKRLNYPSYMSDLKRIKSGNYHLKNSYTLDDLDNGNYKIISINDAIKNMPHYNCNDFLYKRVYNGMPIRIYDRSEDILFITYKNNLIAIYEKFDENGYKAKRVWK